jgi:hypothetical protein
LYDLALNSNIVNDWENPIPAAANCGRTTEYHPNQQITKLFLAECYLLQDNWFEDPTCMADISDNLMLDYWDNNGYYFNEISDPRVFEAHAKTSKYNKDNPSFDTTTCGPFHAQFWQAMRTKFNTLTQDFDCWEYVSNPGKDVLPSTWVFKNQMLSRWTRQEIQS